MSSCFIDPSGYCQEMNAMLIAVCCFLILGLTLVIFGIIFRKFRKDNTRKGKSKIAEGKTWMDG